MGFPTTRRSQYAGLPLSFKRKEHLEHWENSIYASVASVRLCLLSTFLQYIIHFLLHPWCLIPGEPGKGHPVLLYCTVQGHDKPAQRTDTFLASPCSPVLCVRFLSRAEVCARFAFLTRKSSTRCLWCVHILLCLLLPASALPEWFLWLALVDRKPSDLPPQDRGLPSTPHHPQVGGSGSFHNNHFTPLISCLKKNGRMLL